MGEGWHNNHHHYQSAASQGFFWWEIDMTYYVLTALAWLGVVSELRGVPAVTVAGGARRAFKRSRRATDNLNGRSFTGRGCTWIRFRSRRRCSRLPRSSAT